MWIKDHQLFGWSKDVFLSLLRHFGQQNGLQRIQESLDRPRRFGITCVNKWTSRRVQTDVFRPQQSTSTDLQTTRIDCTLSSGRRLRIVRKRNDTTRQTKLTFFIDEIH